MTTKKKAGEKKISRNVIELRDTTDNFCEEMRQAMGFRGKTDVVTLAVHHYYMTQFKRLPEQLSKKSA